MTRKINMRKAKERDKEALIEVIQISRRKNMPLDDAWVNWWRKSEKYIGKNKARYVKKFDKELE